MLIHGTGNQLLDHNYLPAIIRNVPPAAITPPRRGGVAWPSAAAMDTRGGAAGARMGRPHVIWWHVYPLGFTGAEADIGGRESGGGPPRVAHRLRHLRGWLDYAADLGATGVALGPIFESSTHGYDTVNHYRVDARLGGDAGSTGSSAPLTTGGCGSCSTGCSTMSAGRSPCSNGLLRVARARRQLGGSGSPGPKLARMSRHTPRSRATQTWSRWTTMRRRGRLRRRRDVPLAGTGRGWLAPRRRLRGANRLLGEGAGPECGPRFPDAYFVGEVIHGDYTEIVRTSHLDAVTQYELWKAIWSCLNDRNFFELAWALDRHNRYLGSFCPLTFVGNHDVTRLASRLTDSRHLAHAIVVLLTTGGTPTIYYGDEQGFVGVKEDRAGGDDAVRPPFPAAPADLDASGRATYQLHQELISLRRQHSWLHTPAPGSCTWPTRCSSTRCSAGDALARDALAGDVPAGEERLVVALSLADAAVSADVPVASCWPGRRPWRPGRPGSR